MSEELKTPGDSGSVASHGYPYPEVQPRYAAYCVKNGKNPDEMLEADRKRWPGGVMCGYILWIQKSILRYRKAKPEAFLGTTLIDQDGFIDFLYG
jgi:hypothetical protein